MHRWLCDFYYKNIIVYKGAIESRFGLSCLINLFPKFFLRIVCYISLLTYRLIVYFWHGNSLEFPCQKYTIRLNAHSSSEKCRYALHAKTIRSLCRYHTVDTQITIRTENQCWSQDQWKIKQRETYFLQYFFVILKLCFRAMSNEGTFLVFF